MDLHQVLQNKAEWVGHLATELTAAISSQMDGQTQACFGPRLSKIC